jgi:hypothetical protein
MGNKIHVLGGGTLSFIRNHLALAAPARGGTARELYGLFVRRVAADVDSSIPSSVANRVAAERVTLHQTVLAAPHQSTLVTNDDVAELLEQLKADPETRVIIMNVALCDYVADVVEVNYANGSLGEISIPIPRGSHAERLKSRDGPVDLRLTAAPKLLETIRRDRKDIFVVGFKTTTNATPEEQYRIALDSLKGAGINLVFANDTVTRRNMIVMPEETNEDFGTDRKAALKRLVDIVMARSSNTFTRSTVVPGEPVPWDSPLVPENLREVVNHCIDHGAYKLFRGATVGHFAFKYNDQTIITSKRKANFNNLREIGMVQIEYQGDDNVIAFGAKPSVGGQSQRIIFKEHPDADCIVHFHCPLKADHADPVNVAAQWPNECGSHQCGQNTSDNLGLTDDRSLKVVMLDNHGPNIVFSRHTPARKVIDFIERNFDLSQKTGGLVA